MTARVPGFFWLLLAIALLAPARPSRVEAGANPYMALFLGYSKAVSAVAVSPDGRQAASGGQDNLLRLWDLPTGLLLRTFDGETNKINAVSFSPDGKKLLIGSANGQVRLFDIATGWPAPAFEGHSGAVYSVSFVPSGSLALSAGADGTVKLWDLQTGQLLKSLEAHAGGAFAAAFSPDGKQALSGGRDHTLKLWDLETGTLAKTFEGHTDDVTALTFSPDGALAVSAGRDKTVRLWDIAKGLPLRTFEGHAGPVTAVAFAGSSRILSAGQDATLKLWDMDTGALLKTLKGHTEGVTAVAVPPGKGAALSGSLDKSLKLWDLDSGQAQKTIDLQATAFSPDGYRNFFRGVGLRPKVDAAALDAKLRDKGLKRGAPVFLRFFKADLQAELWVQSGGRFVLFETYSLCAWSGQLGPKVREGDGQAPEGFYTIAKSQLKPDSHYHRAFNIGFPNAFDRAWNRTGAFLMVHGSCASVGCYAMTDEGIDEIWALVTAALDAGQERVGLHAFPFRMTAERMAAFQWHPEAAFWNDLKPAYDFFEEDRIPPKISVCNKRYQAERGSAADIKGPTLQVGCGAPAPPFQSTLSSATTLGVR